MCRISRDINAAHSRIDEVGMSLVLIGDWHDVNERIIVKIPAFDAIKDGQTV